MIVRKRRRLAGAVAAKQHRHLASRHGKVHAVRDVVRADVRVALQFEQLVSYCGLPARRRPLRLIQRCCQFRGRSPVRASSGPMPR